MARPKILRGTYVNLLMGNAAAPEVFAPLCGITTRSFTHSVNTQDVFLRDCADPVDVPSREIMATGEQWELSGSGVLNRSNLSVMQLATGIIKNFRFELGQPTGDAVFGGYWAGQAMQTSFKITGEDGAFVTVDVTIQSNGDWAFTTVP